MASKQVQRLRLLVSGLAIAWICAPTARGQQSSSCWNGAPVDATRPNNVRVGPYASVYFNHPTQNLHNNCLGLATTAECLTQYGLYRPDLPPMPVDQFARQMVNSVYADGSSFLYPSKVIDTSGNEVTLYSQQGIQTIGAEVQKQFGNLTNLKRWVKENPQQGKEFLREYILRKPPTFSHDDIIPVGMPNFEQEVITPGFKMPEHRPAGHAVILTPQGLYDSNFPGQMLKPIFYETDNGMGMQYDAILPSGVKMRFRSDAVTFVGRLMRKQVELCKVDASEQPTMP